MWLENNSTRQNSTSCVLRIENKDNDQLQSAAGRTNNNQIHICKPIKLMYEKFQGLSQYYLTIFDIYSKQSSVFQIECF